jgi:arylsulfatase A-like enzyme
MNRPNIIYIYADDLGKGMLSCYGQTQIKTPNIDRIAQQGIRFTRAYGNAFCAPARASLLCGIHDAHAGRWTYSPGNIYKKIAAQIMDEKCVEELIWNTGMQPKEGRPFLPQILKENGYVTGEIGKLEWGFATCNKEMKAHGWDYHYGYYDHIMCHGFYPPFLFENGERMNIQGNTDPHCGCPSYELGEDGNLGADMSYRKVYSQDLFDEKIKWFIESNKDRPFFLFHPSQLPHGPVFYPEYHPGVKDHLELLPIEKEYASMVLRLDDTVGMILDSLSACGITENTLVIFASDNGHESSYYEVIGRNQKSMTLQGKTVNNINEPFRTETCGDVFNGNDHLAGQKFTNWDGGNRICFLAQWPGVIKEGSISNDLIANYDTYSTFCELVNKEKDWMTDGVSYLPIFKGERRKLEPEYILFASKDGPAMVTRDGWKLRLYIPKICFEEATMTNQNLIHDKRVIKQLYYLVDDEMEKNDLAEEHPEKVDSLLAKLLKECDGNFYNGTPNAHFARYTIEMPDFKDIAKGAI